MTDDFLGLMVMMGLGWIPFFSLLKLLGFGFTWVWVWILFPIWNYSSRFCICINPWNYIRRIKLKEYI